MRSHNIALHKFPILFYSLDCNQFNVGLLFIAQYFILSSSKAALSIFFYLQTAGRLAVIPREKSQISRHVSAVM